MDGHGSHETPEFEEFCRKRNIVTLTMPAHASHLLQPLDVGCFAPLKKAYGQRIENLIRNHINHISKLEFIPAFRDAFFASITPSNIRASFRGAGLVPFDPDAVISKLDVRLQTPVLSSDSEAPWSAKTPGTQAEFGSQINFVRNRIVDHPNSSPTRTTSGLDQLLKGAMMLATQNALLVAENRELKTAAEAASKRRQRSKKRIQKRGTLTAQDVFNLRDQNDANAQIQGEIVASQVSGRGNAPQKRRCGYCREPGHRIETCPIRSVEGSDRSSEYSN